MVNKLTIGVVTLFGFQTMGAYAVCDRNRIFGSESAPATSELFGVTICSDRYTEEVTYGSSQIESLIDQLDESELRQRFPGFDEHQDNAFFQANFRGLPVTAAFPNQGNEGEGARLVFKVPSLGICEEWGEGEAKFCSKLNQSGGSREANKDKLKDYLKSDGDKILKELVKVSSVDPVAGNPSSLQTEMAESEFNSGTQERYTVSSKPSSGSVEPNHIGIGARFGHYTQGDRSIKVFTLPLSYKAKFEGGKELTFRLPITYAQVEDAKSYRAMLGLSYKIPITNSWALSPSISYGAVGSIDLGTLAQLTSTSMTSDYLLIDRPKFALRMGNMVGYYTTLPLSAGDYDIDVDVTNTLVRNGLSMSVPLGKFAGHQMSVETFLVDTRFFGDELYVEQYNEIGFSIGPQTEGKVGFSRQKFGLGVKYLHFSDGHAFTLNFGYEF